MSMTSLFDRQMRISWWDQSKLDQARVMIVGAGALGNEVLKNLALVGVGNLLIVDFDMIEDSNLSRSVLFRRGDLEGRHKAAVAAERIRELSPNPDITVSHLCSDIVWELGTGVYRHQDLVVGCLDNIEARLALNENCWRAGIPWIDGGIYELSGSVSVFEAKRDQACYECLMDKERYQRANIRYSCTNRVVKANLRQGKIATTQTTSAIIAALQTQEAIKLLHGLDSLGGRRVVYHGHRINFVGEEATPITVAKLTRNPDCPCHLETRYDAVVELEWARAEHTTARELLEWAQDEGSLGMEEPSLGLGRQFVIRAECPLCDWSARIDRAIFRVLDTQVVCPECEVHCPRCDEIACGQPDCPRCGQTDIIEPILVTLSRLQLAVDQSQPYLDLSLHQLGVPRGHILSIEDTATENRASVDVELTGDVLELIGFRSS